MSADTKTLELPTLDELLSARGVFPNPKTGDYQDYIEEREKDTEIGFLGLSRVFPQGSMHLALKRIAKTRKFKI